VTALVSGLPTRSLAQPVGARLSTLLVEQGPAPQGYVRDVAAAEATFSTVAGLFLVELSTLPLTSSSGGFVYRLNPALGLVERASDSFGPFFTERALRVGRRQFSFGLTYQFANFSTLQGSDLDTGTFPTNTARQAGAIDPFSVDTLTLELDARTVTAVASYGVTNDFDIGLALPFTTVSFSGRRVNTFNGQTSFQLSESGSASGLGDITLNARYRVAGDRARALAFGSDLRLPTGREEDLLGAGQTTIRALVIGSWERGRLATHLNTGVGAGGASGEVFWSGAATVAVAPRVTLVGELLGRRLNQLHRVRDVYQPHPVLQGIETMRWLPEEGGVNTAYTAVGLKWNAGRNWLLNTNLLIRLTDVGLRARVTPAISVDYTFAQ
jgi:hypothetical protein